MEKNTNKLETHKSNLAYPLKLTVCSRILITMQFAIILKHIYIFVKHFHKQKPMGIILVNSHTK